MYTPISAQRAVQGVIKRSFYVPSEVFRTVNDSRVAALIKRYAAGVKVPGAEALAASLASSAKLFEGFQEAVVKDRAAARESNAKGTAGDGQLK